MNDQPSKPNVNVKKIAVVIIPILFAVLTTAVVATMIGGGNDAPIGGEGTPSVIQTAGDLPTGAEPEKPSDKYSVGLSYRANSDGSVTVTGIGSCADRTVRIPDVTDSGAPVTAIGDSAFASVKGIDEVIMPSSIISIGAYAFKASSISAVTVGASVFSIGAEAFADCFGLAAINVDGANAMFASASGVLFSRDMSVIICYPAGRPDSSYVIPKEVTEIRSKAFSSCPALRSLKFEGNAEAWKRVYIESGNSLIDRLSVEVDTSDK